MRKGRRCLCALTLAGAVLLGSVAVWAADLGKPENTENRGGETNGLTDRIQTLYDTEKGLPANEANAILQTQDGYLWIGSYGGLIRYDGRTFLNYSLEKNGLEASGIRALFEDARGRMWVGTNDRGVYIYEGGDFTPCPAADGGLYQSIRCFAQDKEGVVYVGTSMGLLLADGEGTLKPLELDQLKNQTIYSLSFDENGALWGTAGAGYAFCLLDGELLYWFEPGTLSPEENYAVLADGGRVYIGTGGNRLICLTFKDGGYTEHSYEAEIYYTGEIQTINTLLRTEEGELWMGANTGYGWFDAAMELHTLPVSERAAFIDGLIQDYEGNIWMASTQRGVYRLARGRFQNANDQAGLAGQPINAVARTGGLLYAASDYGLFIVDGSWTPVRNELTDLLKGVRVRHAFADSRGDLWISTYGPGGLLRYRPGTGEIISITEDQGLLSNKVRNVIELKNGDLAVATTEGVNILRGAEIVGGFGQREGLVNPVILCLLELSDGTLLAGSDGQGIYKIKNGKVTNLFRGNGLDSGVVLRMREDEAADGIWISAGDSLFFMDRDQNIRRISELHSGVGSIFDIMVMKDDILLMKSSGLIAAPRDCLLGRQEMAVTELGADSGLTESINANSWSYFENGILYLCTANGVFLLDETHSAASGAAPRAAVNEIRFFCEGEDQEHVRRGGEDIALPSGARRVTIQFACLSFGLSPCEMEYYLEGFDRTPVRVPADEVNSVSYTNLRGGSYTFHLKAVNGDGVESVQEIAVNIQKELHYYEHGAFWAAIVVFAFLIAVLTIHLVLLVKTRQLRRRQQEYKAITDQALKTIANTIDAKDSYTKGHSVRVAACAEEIARRLGMDEETRERIHYIALMHDIGKIGIPDRILNKPGKLTDEEFDIMRSHTVIGGEILKDFTALPDIGEGALSHHERFGGGGYPAGLKGEEIPLVARIICAADAYDAMSTKRAYREPMSREYILSEFQSCSGSQFDPKIAEIMISMLENE